MRAGLRKPLRAPGITLPSKHISTARKKRLDLIVKRRRGDPFTRVEQLARTQSRRTQRSVARLAEQKCPLIADVLRVGIEPA